MVKGFGTTSDKRRAGIVALVPSFNRAKDWEACGAIIGLLGIQRQRRMHRYWGLGEGAFDSCAGGTWSDFSIWTETTLKVPLASRA